MVTNQQTDTVVNIGIAAPFVRELVANFVCPADGAVLVACSWFRKFTDPDVIHCLTAITIFIVAVVWSQK